jgi:hypothetical protein
MLATTARHSASRLKPMIRATVYLRFFMSAVLLD